MIRNTGSDVGGKATICSINAQPRMGVFWKIWMSMLQTSKFKLIPAYGPAGMGDKVRHRGSSRESPCCHGAGPQHDRFPRGSQG